MKFVKLLLIGLLAINSVLSTEETKFRLKKSHHKKGKTFLQKNRQTPPSPAPPSNSGGSLTSLDGNDAANTQVVNQYSDLAKKTNILDMVPDQDPSVIDLKLGPGPTYFKGWIKYFKYDADENQQQRPTTFFKNTEFYQQSRKYPNADVTQKENGMYKYIKNEMFFYAVLNYDSVNIMASRIQKLVHTYDTISIDLITPQVEDRTYHGGITDFGNFAEGFCFRVDTSQTRLTELPKGNVPLKSWIICTETAAEKGNFMTALRKVKVKHQRDQGVIINNSAPPVEPQVGDLLRGVTPNLKQDKEGNLGVTFNATENKITDGYWITLQDWTQCSLKCGGGVSTLHRMCVPPKTGGKPCDGPAILTKPCNVQPCPQVKQLKEIKQRQNQGFKNPVVKIMPFSDRPQRYTKCVIKESDMMYTKLFQENYQYVDNVQLPVRVVMNNKTISIFGSSDDYTSVMTTFDLQATDISPSKNHPNCFILNQGAITETNKLQAELCPFGLDKSEETYQAWMYDFNLFKYQCKTERETVDLDAADARALNDKYKKKVANAKLDIVEDRENLLKDKLAKQEEKNINVQVIKTNQMAMQAVQKEMTLEEMVKKEEEEREAEAEKEVLQKLDEEKEKQDCLVKRIKEKELEDQYNIKIQEAAQEMKKIKDQAEKQLLIKRSMLKSDILKMRKKAERRKAQLEAQLQGVRIQMSKDMGKIYKDGDMNKCKEAMQNQQNRETYCGVNYPDDYVRFSDCKSDDDFCYFCCETEFGDMHMDKRQQCYDTLCNPQKQPDASGKWIWVVDANAALANEAIKPPTFS